MILSGVGLLFLLVIAGSVFLFHIGSGVPPKCQQEPGVGCFFMETMFCCFVRQ